MWYGAGELWKIETVLAKTTSQLCQIIERNRKYLSTSEYVFVDREACAVHRRRPNVESLK